MPPSCEAQTSFRHDPAASSPPEMIIVRQVCSETSWILLKPKKMIKKYPSGWQNHPILMSLVWKVSKHGWKKHQFGPNSIMFSTCDVEQVTTSCRCLNNPSEFCPKTHQKMPKQMERSIPNFKHDHSVFVIYNIFFFFGYIQILN